MSMLSNTRRISSVAERAERFGYSPTPKASAASATTPVAERAERFGYSPTPKSSAASATLYTEFRWLRLPPRMAVLLFVTLSCLSSSAFAQQQKVVLVVGAGGTDEYTKQFAAWADNWQKTIQSGGDAKPEFVRIGTEVTERTDAEILKAEILSTSEDAGEIWIVLIGHGTDDRTNAKFNLRGPDVSATQLNEWLSALKCRVVVINCSSASGRFINVLKHENRIVVTAAKSGAQHNFARFGGYLSTAIDDPAFDLDKDQQTSLLEAFLAASSQTQEFYLQESRLATELAMIDDNGDGLGTPADWFDGTRVVRKSTKGDPDGFAANQVFLIRRGVEAKLSSEQRLERDRLEQELEQLRDRKSTMPEAAYYETIEPILLELSTLYQAAEESEESKDDEQDVTDKMP